MLTLSELFNGVNFLGSGGVNITVFLQFVPFLTIIMQ